MGNSSSQPATTDSVAKDVKEGVDKAVKKTNVALKNTSDKATKTGKEANKAVSNVAKSVKKEEDRLSKRDVAVAVPVVALLVAAGYFGWKKFKKNTDGKSKPAKA